MSPNSKRGDYLACEVYQTHAADAVHARYSRMVCFEHTDGRHYFLTLTDGGVLAFRSRAFPDPVACEAAMGSVDGWLDAPGRRGVTVEDHAYYATLKAHDGGELARSCAQVSVAAAQAFLAPAGKLPTTPVAPASAHKSDTPWWVWALLGLVALSLCWLLLRGGDDGADQPDAPAGALGMQTEILVPTVSSPGTATPSRKLSTRVLSLAPHDVCA